MQYKISDLAKVLGVTSNTIRRYEKNGYIVPYRDKSDYRWYKAKDIVRTAAIRLYRKCGFSHEEIMQMLDSSSKNIMDVCTAKLAEIDAEMDRLKYLRHWLKDNIELLRTAEKTGDGYIIMDCPATKYVIYSENEKLLTEKDRLKTINMFMYHIHEVQMMYLVKEDAVNSPEPVINLGWVMKEMDIKRLHLENEVTSDNPYIIDYPSKKCLYSIFEYPANLNMGDEQLTSAINAHKEKLIDHMNNQGYTLDGDIMMIVVNAIGNIAQLLCCVPIK